MIKCVAIYPHKLNNEYEEKVKEVVSLAFKYNFNEIFTTIHLPEYSIETQLECYKIIYKNTKEKKLDLTVDIGGHFIDMVLKDEKYFNLLLENTPDFIRLDYGYDFDQVKQLYEKLQVRGFVINASTYSQSQIDKLYKSFKDIDEKIEIRACHNYYIRPESGIDSSFALTQDSYFNKYNIPIYYCIPTHLNPRDPLNEGLCTIEKHRYMKLKDILIDLIINHKLSAFMMADEWLSEEEFKEIENTLNLLYKGKNNHIINVEFFDTTTQLEKNIVLGKHTFRYDSPIDNLRSQSSRQMAEFAMEVEPNNTIERKKGSITIDNKLYKRYSGEMQVMLKDFVQNEKVNVVGKIDEEDEYKLLYYKDGYEYEFKEK